MIPLRKFLCIIFKNVIGKNRIIDKGKNINEYTFKNFIIMKNFMDENFLLQTQTAQELYHNHAAKMPIIDYHCHLIPQW